VDLLSGFVGTFWDLRNEVRVGFTEADFEDDDPLGVVRGRCSEIEKWRPRKWWEEAGNIKDFQRSLRTHWGRCPPPLYQATEDRPSYALTSYGGSTTLPSLSWASEDLRKQCKMQFLHVKQAHNSES